MNQEHIRVSRIASIPKSVEQGREPRYQWTKEFVDITLPRLTTEALKRGNDVLALFTLPKRSESRKAFISNDAINALLTKGFIVRHGIDTTFAGLHNSNRLIVMKLSENRKAVARITKSEGMQTRRGPK